MRDSRGVIFIGAVIRKSWYLYLGGGGGGGGSIIVQPHEITAPFMVSLQ